MNYSKVGDAKSVYENVAAKAYSFDISYHRSLVPLKIVVNFKSQLNYLAVDKADYIDETGAAYSFENNSYMYYGRLSVRPGFVKNKLLKRLEFLYRYNYANYAKDALWGGVTKRNDIGISYWLSLRTGLRIAYEATETTGKEMDDAILVRFVTGF